MMEQDKTPLVMLARDTLLEPEEKRIIRNILEECDKDFWPPLSSRSGTSQQLLLGETVEENGVELYCREVLEQSAILAKLGEEIVGFLSYRPSYRCSALEEYGEVAYMTTLCLRHSQRGKGYSPGFYHAAEKRIWERFPHRRIAFRTWSTNLTQLHLAEKLGYQAVAVLKNDRGEGIDTVYYIKNP